MKVYIIHERTAHDQYIKGVYVDHKKALEKALKLTDTDPYSDFWVNPYEVIE